jgi:hypothetical protein
MDGARPETSFPVTPVTPRGDAGHSHPRRAAIYSQSQDGWRRDGRRGSELPNGPKGSGGTLEAVQTARSPHETAKKNPDGLALPDSVGSGHAEICGRCALIFRRAGRQAGHSQLLAAALLWPSGPGRRLYESERELETGGTLRQEVL